MKREKKKNSITPSKSIKREVRDYLASITTAATAEEDVNDDATSSIGLLCEEDESSTIGSISGLATSSSKKRKKTVRAYRSRKINFEAKSVDKLINLEEAETEPPLTANMTDEQG